MTNLQYAFPLDHRVFQGGRYLRAFDHLSDIDHYEHSILTYLGSLMPFDKAFVDHPAFPSIARIASSTKISASTVRDRLKALKKKGYVNVKEVRFLNSQGHFQQSSNNYYLSVLAFQIFDDVLESQTHISEIMKRAVGGGISFNVSQSSSSADTVGYFESQQSPLSAVMPNSLPQSSAEDPKASSYSRDIFSIKAEVDRIVEAWEKLLNLPVNKGEKEKFFCEYVRTSGNEIYYSERILSIASDPYLTSRARSINFLFSGLDCALRNKADIVKKGRLALLSSRNEKELSDTISQIPAFIQHKSQRYSNPSDAIVKHLLQDPINEAKKQLGLQQSNQLPKTDRELGSEVQRLLNTDILPERRSELEIILASLPRLNFSYCLELYDRCAKKMQAAEATQ
ncbi:MAG: helix-turn-helix domain-containing protein [Pseudobdellovibrionaceae bacterium]|nr:helix-turn-helix domain-containing protein [Pseudobdellovibrionaceae bacterium]